jgi:hypothetical protein
LFLLNKNRFFFDLAWSVDGQLLAVAKDTGAIYVYLTKLSMLASVWQQKIAFMTSLCEVSIYDHQTKTKVKNIFFSIKKNELEICSL